MLLYILIILDIILVPLVGYVLFTLVKRIKTLVKDYDALEQGFTEVTDAYETDSLQYEETIEALHEQKEIDRIARHEQDRTIRALRGKVERRNNMIQMLTEENAGVRRQLDIAQVIILEHDQNCLPHVVLTSMEGEKDTPLPMDCES